MMPSCSEHMAPLLTAPAEPTFLGVITAQNGALYELNVNSAAMPTINIDASNMDGDPEGGPEPGSAPTSPSDKDGNKSPSAATHNVSPNPSPAAKDHAARTAKVDGNPQ
ncbi:hypothetical protein SARC_01364 [Sphaeroforma arctica JP610]|uniref:Uncharacterized protein n=1 Tax=Sphaeroforma arctica JP610 TaxID=667725 RepID=A0A0L0GE04_9EUKA|nr:hypothetical protein SARC_01364 [Sphaeroforma arctica JP610]KNC86493.1 hypothetical protein SARC_01364 [Sphaeroforma arctica JP610]|eukprot:XP_014160395.1 hypothetical protein SARC_01364 [Sphaeroforma arctica JP610]